MMTCYIHYNLFCINKQIQWQNEKIIPVTPYIITLQEADVDWQRQQIKKILTTTTMWDVGGKKLPTGEI